MRSQDHVWNLGHEIRLHHRTTTRCQCKFITSLSPPANSATSSFTSISSLSCETSLAYSPYNRKQLRIYNQRNYQLAPHITLYHSICSEYKCYTANVCNKRNPSKETIVTSFSRMGALNDVKGLSNTVT